MVKHIEVHKRVGSQAVRLVKGRKADAAEDDDAQQPLLEFIEEGDQEEEEEEEEEEVEHLSNPWLDTPCSGRCALHIQYKP